MKRTDSIDTKVVSSQHARGKPADHSLRPSELPKRDKKRGGSLIDPPLPYLFPKKQKKTSRAGSKSGVTNHDGHLSRSKSQASRFGQVKEYLTEASSKELDSLRNYLLKLRPLPADDQKPKQTLKDLEESRRDQSRSSLTEKPRA